MRGFGHAHAPSRLDGRGIDLAYASEGEREDRRHGQEHQRDHDRRVAEPEPDHADDEHRERRDGAANVRDVDESTPERLLRPSNRPPGTAIADAIAIDVAHSERCCRTRCRNAIGALPVGRIVEPDEELMQRVHAALTRRAQGVSSRSVAHEHQVERDRERDGQPAADEQGRVEVASRARRR